MRPEEGEGAWVLLWLITGLIEAIVIVGSLQIWLQLACRVVSC